MMIVSIRYLCGYLFPYFRMKLREIMTIEINKMHSNIQYINRIYFNYKQWTILTVVIKIEFFFTKNMLPRKI